ncbi:hypothetical protein ACLOJK_034610 [Asimina triloba]
MIKDGQYETRSREEPELQIEGSQEMRGDEERAQEAVKSDQMTVEIVSGQEG